MKNFYDEVREMSKSILEGRDADDDKDLTEEEEEFLRMSVEMASLYIKDAAALGKQRVEYDCMADMRKKVFDKFPQRFREKHGAHFMIIKKEGGVRSIVFDWAEKNHV